MLRLRTAVLLLGGALLCGCGPDAEAGSTAVPEGDAHYALTRLRDAYGADEGVQPEDVEQALPNHRMRVRGTGRTVTFSDALVTGTVTGVSKGNGVVWRDEHDFTLVAYDDPRADTRCAIIVLAPEETVGIPGEGGPVAFRVPVPQEADPDRFLAGLAGLDQVAVVLSRDPTDTEATPLRPILGDRLIGVVAVDGSLRFPALGRRGPSFEGDIHTVDQLVAAARAPVWTTTIPRP